MADGFNEHMVIQKSNWKKKLKVFLVVFLAVILSSLPILFFLYTGIDVLQISLIVLIGSIWGAKIIIKRMHVEFEYSIFGSEMTVDKILGRGIRKRLLKVDFQKFEILSQRDLTQEHRYKDIDKILDASSSEDSPDRWFAVFQSAENTRTLLIFEPSKKMLDAFGGYIPSKIQNA